MDENISISMESLQYAIFNYESSQNANTSDRVGRSGNTGRRGNGDHKAGA